MVAVLGAFLGAVLQALNGHGLDVASYDWTAIGNLAWQAGIAYLAKNFLTTSDGKVLGAI